jgi:crotonobetainyl-CoA:carnitine CoA-transferase CaiB-like acyl-CoA transferase
MTNEGRIVNRDELIPLIAKILRTRDAECWLSLLQEAQIPCAPINSIPDILSDPHYVARGNIIEVPYHGRELQLLASPLRLVGTPPSYRLPPPLLGEHTDEILASIGLHPTEIASMHKEGIV